ncbi:MAG: EAL domain-containing protein [Acidimicrobiales bacterium]|nr:EAL domain-containing protein [Acidimicrobiales bacterium]
MATVLLVDDEQDLLRSAKVALRRQPFDVITATSAQEGLDLLAEHDVAVVVSDERMPGMPGSVFLTHVRNLHPDVERIILTGQASMEATIAAINEARVFRFLVKPCPPDELAETIIAALAAREARLASDVRATADDELAGRLDQALETLWVAFQPIVTRPPRRLYAYEALLRSNEPSLPSPPDVLDASVRLDRRFEVDRVVRQRVAEAMGQVPDEALVFVNLVPDSLCDPQFLGDDDPLHPFARRVVLEVTERASLDDIPDATDHLATLRARGYRVALDDLGAGYAGLTSFATLAPDVVKFDMELVRDISESDTRSKLVASMVAVCRELGILSLAEGVETDSELHHLEELGCDLFQGYRIAKPDAAFWLPTD